MKEKSRLHGLYPKLCLLYVELQLVLYLNVVDSTMRFPDVSTFELRMAKLSLLMVGGLL